MSGIPVNVIKRGVECQIYLNGVVDQISEGADSPLFIKI